MVNFGLNPASILGIFLAVAGASLYFMRSVKPEVSRDHDIFFAAVGLLCGFILLFQGWRLDPILQFGQFLLTGSAIFFAVESIRLRGLATDQARRNSRIVDEDRPVNSTRVYRAELDRRLEPYREEPTYDEERNPRGYGEDVPPPSPNRYEQNRPNDRRPPSRRSPEQPPQTNYYDRPARPSRDRYNDDPRRNPRWEEEIPDHWNDSRQSPSRRPNRGSTDPNREPYDRPAAPNPPGNRRRPRPDFIAPEEEITPVDYQPIDDNQGEIDNPSNPNYSESDRRDNAKPWSESDNRKDNINFDY